MKMVSAARLRKAQDRVLLARPYAHSLRELMAHTVAATSASEKLAGHPLLARREEKRIQLILFTSDRGLAGSFNSNLIKAAEQFVASKSETEVVMEPIGRKGADYFRKRGANISGIHVDLASQALFEDVAPIANDVMDRFEKAEIDAVYLLYNEFKSMLSQKVTVHRLLPMDLPEKGEAPTEYIYEQSPEELLDAFLPRYVRVTMHHALLESTAAEHAARMTAMDAATSNASELIDKLTLYMNRVRQASITTEIIEVVSGAVASE
jgi:F-type H+-transporting ATPase subunit gamma